MLKVCSKCSLLFIPSRKNPEMCGQCAPAKREFEPKPIDLWLQWADRD
jgi:hypothetical protein